MTNYDGVLFLQFYQGLMDLSLVLVVLILGQTIKSLPLDPGLTDFLFLWLGKISFWVCPKEVFVNYA
jgi:hypothetical protein